jgi:gentisate 1,2-dioxygenase
MHRFAAGTVTATTKVVGSAVWQVFDGAGAVHVGDERFEVAKGDLFAVPSWAPVRFETDGPLDAFRFSDDPVYEALGLARREIAR